MKKQLTLLLPALVMISCGTNDDMPTQPTFDSAAQLSALHNYAALGNSLTAGYQNGAWGNPHHVGNSFPNLIARQLGISNFKQVSMAGGGLTFVDADGDGVPETPAGNMVVNFDETGSPVLSYTEFETAAAIFMDPSAYVATDLSAPRNFGIPGITLMHSAGAPLEVYYGNGLGNPYAGFYLPAGAGMTQLGAVLASGASFVTCWLGNNDVLGYVTSGGTDAITDEATFQASLDGALGGLGASTEYIAVMNIPGVTSIPFVTYFNPVLREMLAANGMDPIVMVMDDDLGVAVPVDITEGNGNYVLLPAATAMAANPMLGSPFEPLPDALVLDAAEVAAAETAEASFNTMIAAGVDALNAAGRSHDVLHVDMNSFFSEVVAHGYEAFGESFSAEFVTGGMFSLDGVHPTSLGYAVIANEILDAMNEGWGYNIMPVDLNEFMGTATGLGSIEHPGSLPSLEGMVEMFSN